MQKILTYLYLGFGIFNVYLLVESFVTTVAGPYNVLFWETNLTGYRIKCAVFALIFLYAYWGNYQKSKQ